MRIPILDLAPDIDALWPELTAAFERVMRSGQFIGGPEVEAFEREAAAWLGAKHAVGLNSGTDALVIALRALGIGPGDEVITTPFSFFATAEAISNVGATPVFVDADEATMNLDVRRIAEAVTARTKAVMPVHLFGRPVDMDALRDAVGGLAVVEDCAQSFGASWRGQPTGTFGAAGCFSFFPSKNLGAFGDAGMLVTDDDAMADAARMLRAHGSRTKYRNEALGYNSRLDALHAALLRVKLPHVSAANAGRRAAAERYTALLEDASGVIVPEIVDGHVFHQYTVRILDGRRDAVQAALAQDGIGTMVYYPIPQDRLPVYEGRMDNPPRFPVSERLAAEVLSLPIWPTIDEATQAEVADALRGALA